MKKFKAFRKMMASAVMSVALALGMVPVLPTAAVVHAEPATEIETTTETWSGEMVVKHDVSLSTANLKGDTFLTIEPGATLTVTGGINRSDGSGSMYSLTVQGGMLTVSSKSPYGIFVKNLTVESGIVKAATKLPSGTGIGATGSLTINGGVVEATGGEFGVLANSTELNGGALKANKYNTNDENLTVTVGNIGKSYTAFLKGGDVWGKMNPGESMSWKAIGNNADNAWLATGYAKGTCGETGKETDVTWEYIENGCKTSDQKDARTLIISGDGNMQDYSDANQVPWKDHADKITDVVIGKGVTSISEYVYNKKNPAQSTINAFSTCYNLECIYVEDGNTSYYSKDGVLYKDGEKDTLLLCPYKKTGSITVPKTVRIFEEHSFFNTIGNEPVFTSLSEVRFEKCDPNDDPYRDVALRGDEKGYAFGKDYNGECRFIAPEGFVLGFAIGKEMEGAMGYSSFAVKDMVGDHLYIRPHAHWDDLQATIANGGGKTVTLEDDWDYKAGRDGGYQYEEKHKEGGYAYCGALDIPEDTVLDLNGHTLTALVIFARGNITIKNGTLNSAIVDNGMMGNNSKGSTLNLSGVEATLTQYAPDGAPLALCWTKGWIKLTNTKLVVDDTKGEVLSMWIMPESGKPLSMDKTSSFTLPQILVPKDLDYPEMNIPLDRFLLTYSDTKPFNKDQYNSLLGSYLPSGTEFVFYDLGYMDYNEAYCTYIGVKKTSDGSYPERVTFTAPKYPVTVNSGSGSGDYVEGETVTIKADPAPEGKEFDKWTGTDNLSLTRGDSSTQEAEFTMPAQAVTVTATYKDAPMPALISIKKATVTNVTDKTYNGKALTQNPIVKVGNKKLVKGKDYTISYKNNKKAGKATMTITGIGAYTDSKNVAFKILSKAQAKDIKNAKVTGVANKKYTGKAITQNPVVNLGGKKLKKDRDYTVIYKDNTNAGKATITIKAKGKTYSGSKTVTFNILKAANPIKISGKVVNLKESDLKKDKSVTASTAYRISTKGKGKLSYSKVKVTPNQSKESFTIDPNGNIRIKKGLKEGTYKVNVKVVVAGDKNYKGTTKAVTVTFKVQ